MFAQTIEQILEQLNGIIDQALQKEQRIGYFTGLYERVTSNVRRSLVAGNVFQNNPRMGNFDVVFANRFLTAWQQHCDGQQPTASWQIAFAQLDNDEPLIVQHLLLGMNAHINLDLGIAAATIAPTADELQSLWPDFLTINAILARLTQVVEVELGQVSPRLGRIEEFAPGIESKIFDFGLDAARDFAWALAIELVNAPADNWQQIIATRDQQVACLGKDLFPLHGLAGEVAKWIKSQESTNISYNILVIGE
jgi:hypothetical protein